MKGEEFVNDKTLSGSFALKSGVVDTGSTTPISKELKLVEEVSEELHDPDSYK